MELSGPSTSNQQSQRRRRHISRTQKEILLQQVYEEGMTIVEAAKIAQINKNSAKTIIATYKINNSELVERSRGGKKRTKLTGDVLNKIERLVECNRGITLKDMKARLAQDNINVSIQTIQNGLKKLQITLKLARYEVDRMNCASTLEQRKNYAVDFSQYAPASREKCIFIDECGFNLHLRRTQGRSKKGSRANVQIPTIRGRNVTLIGAINTQGTLHFKIISDSTCNSNKFCEFLRELIEKIETRNDMDGAWFVMDNAKIHKTAEVRELLNASPFELKFLPPYSPMLNPIENVFSKAKACAKRILGTMDPSNPVALNTIIQQSWESITSTDCNNYIMNMMVKLPTAAAGLPLS